MSQTILYKFFHNTAFSVQLPYIVGHSFKLTFNDLFFPLISVFEMFDRGKTTPYLHRLTGEKIHNFVQVFFLFFRFFATLADSFFIVRLNFFFSQATAFDRTHLEYSAMKNESGRVRSSLISCTPRPS